MAIMPGEILFLYSMGTTGPTGAQADPTASLGGTVSTTVLTGNINNVWVDVDADDSATGITQYRCLYVQLDAGADQALIDAVIWVENATNLDVALDPASVGEQSEITIAGQTTPPDGVTFAGTAVSLATGLAIGDLQPGHSRAFWEKLTTAPNAANAILVPSVRVSGITDV